MGSQTTIVSIDDINKHSMKFSWGYDHVVNDLTKKGKLPKSAGILRPLNSISIKPLRGGTRGKDTTHAAFKRAHDYKQ
mgnify:CR=1 FL=1